MRKIITIFSFAIILYLNTLPDTSVFLAAPLLQEGKKSLYQRLVSHPGAVLYAGPEENAAVTLNTVKTFTLFYVYAKNGARIQVGVSSSQPDGWIDADKTTAWDQAITMLFTDRATRMPVLFFANHKSLVETCTDENLERRIKNYASAAEAANKRQKNSSIPVIAMEPKESAVSRNRFYLMPVLNLDNQFKSVNLLEVACIDPGTGDIGANSSETKAGSKNVLNPELNTAIAFVIDSTISMRPYIEQSLSLIRSIYDRLEKSPNGDKVAFAVVAYRNNTNISPDLEYTAKVISDFKTVKDRKSLEDALSRVREASSSSHSVDEDSLAGVKEAADKLSWQNYASRVILLLGDAGPISGSDQYSATGMDSSEMADYLRSKNIWLTALHIKNPKTKNNHISAEIAYRELSRMSEGMASYIPIDASSPQKGAADFDKAGKSLTESYRNLVEATAEGRMLTRPMHVKLSDDPSSRAKELGDIMGYAMQLEFLGQKNRTLAPSVVNAWVADADLAHLADNPNLPVMALEPAVLLTKNQLSDLSARLKLIIEEATKSQRLGSTDFFQNIISLSAQLSRDPSRFSHRPGQNLAQTGVLGEFLDGLPYKSDVLNMTEDDWYNKSVGEQAQFINRLKSRLSRYEAYDADRSSWESFGAKNSGDWVYRVPLSMLP